MKTLKMILALTVLFCLLVKSNAFGRPRVALYPAQTSGEKWLSDDASRYLKSTVSQGYRILLPAEFEPLLKKEAESRPDFPIESFYSSLLKYDIGYLILGKAAEESGKAGYQFKVYDLKTDRCRIFSGEVPVEKEKNKWKESLRKSAYDTLRYMRGRDRLELTSQRESEMALALTKRLPKGPRPPVSAAIIEMVSGSPSPEHFAETALLYYLESCGFPVKDGESLLLREYARFYFVNQKRDFPLTLSAEYYIIGTASAEPSDEFAGLSGAASQMEIRVLDREGKVVCGKRVKVEAHAQDPKAAVARALKAAASEIALEVLPLLRY